MQTQPQGVRAQESTLLGITVKTVHTGRGANGRSVDLKTSLVAGDQLQRHIQSLTWDQQHAIGSCQRNMQGGHVRIKRRVDGSGARFSGLITCGDVHVCPNCSSKVTHERGLELTMARNAHVKAGGEVLLMTLTFPHELAQLDLNSLFDLFAAALRKFKNSRTYKRILGTPDKPGRYARIGSVKSLEHTHGPNGWHPHVHEMVFVMPGLLDDQAAIDELRYEWVRLLEKVGLGDSSKRNDMLEHAFDLRGGDYAADYILKYGRQPQLEQWGIVDEVTKSNAKRGTSHGHLTPFALARASLEGDAGAGELFLEFVAAIKGKRSLTWSPGLKKRFGIADATDEDLARAPMPEEEDAGELDPDDWRLVLSRNARGELKFWAAKEGEPGVRAFLEELRSRPRTHQGSFRSSINQVIRNSEINHVMYSNFRG
jgi:hypothetical protein